MTVADNLKTLFEAEWSFSTEPTFCTMDYGHDTDFEKFDANVVTPQVCINSETQKEYTIVVGSTIKVVHDVSLLVYVKPRVYNATEIAAQKTIFNGILGDIDEILRLNRYPVYGTYAINEIQTTGWKIETQKKEEPIVFVALQTIKVIYYLPSTATIFTTRITSVKADTVAVNDVVFIGWDQVHVVTPQLLPSSKIPVGWLQGHAWVKGEIRVKGKSATLENPLTSDASVITELEVIGEDLNGTTVEYNLAYLIITNNALSFSDEGEPVTIYYFLAYSVTPS